MENTILDRNLDPSTTGGTWMDIRPNADRARTAIALLYVMLILDVALIGLTFYQRKVVISGSYSDIQSAALMIGGVALLYLAGYVVGIVMFIRWFRRAYLNLHQIEGSQLSHSEGWAAGAWFVPVVNLAWPFTIMKEIVKGTGEHAQRLTGNTYDNLMPMTISWWIMWLAQYLLGLVNSFVTDPDLSIPLMLITHIFFLTAGVILIMIIRKVAVMEQALYENRERAGMQVTTVYTPRF